nr:MAG TPA: Neck appendage protein [Caudoviricetes sp.]
MPLNAAYSDEIVQEDNSTYQLSFRFPTSDPLWEQLKEETFLTADDLHGEQDFVIFEVEKKHGYIQVYANQVFTLLNNYVVNPISLDRQTGSTALSRFAGSITRDNPFSFFSDIEDRHTFNVGSKNAMEAFAKDKHSIIGQWGGDLVRHGYQVRLLKNGGSENESLFMYKKNLSSYQHKTSTKSLKTRITFIATVKGEGEKAPDRTFTVTIDSPLINKYSQIYEDVIEVNDQDVKDEASLRKYGEQYYRTSLCDMMEDSLEIEVVGQSDVPVQMFDVVSIFHERYNLDVRKKITKYTYSPMAKKLKSIGFGQFQSGLANAIGNAVSDAVKGEAQQLQSDFERQLARELKNADLAFERHKEELVNQFTDGLNAAKTRAEEVKRELSDIIDQQFQTFDNGPLQETKRRAEEALRNAGASSLLAQEAKRIGYDAMARLEAITDPQNGLIATQIANYKTAVDGRFADITSLLAGKANQIDFQRVKETSQLYERILGNTENGIADKVARMALTNQLFQVEVAKASASGRNLFLSSTATKGYLGRAGVINVANSTQKEITSDFISVEPNENIIFQHWVTLPENGMAFSAWQFFDKNKNPIDARITGSDAYKTATGKQHNINQIIVPANAYFIRVSARMYNDGLMKIERGSAPSNYSAAPEDTDEAIRTVQSQLAGSWGVHNKNSVNEIIAGFNLAGRNAGIKAETIRLEGNTLADKLTAIDGYFKRLFVGEGTFATLNADVIRTNSITADKLVVNEALANRLVSNEIITSKLVASRAFVNALNAVTIDASQIVTGTLKGDRIYGGTIRGANIYGGTLTGHTQIQLGFYGSFDTVNGGLQINVPRDYNSKDGLGVQFIGSYGRGENVPYGLFIYKDSDFTASGTVETSDDFLLTVEGYINAKGIGWLKTGKGSVNGKTTGTIGLWNSDNVSLSFGGSGNDIYYSYNGTAYSLWSVVNQHFSDRRLKENIVVCEHNALDYIQQFQFKEYDWKKQDDRPRKAHTKIGLIAQEVQEIDPTLVYENGETLNLDNLRLTTIALKAIQELALENRKLTHRLENLENERRTT